MKRTGAIGFVTAAVLWAGAAGAMAAPPHHHRVSALGGSCIGSASAIAQYCEVIPGAGGGQHPGQGTPTLSATLPWPTVLHLATNPRFRWLLKIPAATRPGAGQGTRGIATAGTSAPTSTGSAALWTPMVLVLAVIALLLGAVEIARRRRVTQA